MALSNKPGVEVTGFVESIVPFYHAADYFVAPFRIARGVQNKILQAMACGLPVVSTRLGAEGIDCCHGENIMMADSSVAFVEQIRILESNPRLKSSISLSASDLVSRQYSWEGKLRVLEEVITP